MSFHLAQHQILIKTKRSLNYRILISSYSIIERELGEKESIKMYRFY